VPLATSPTLAKSPRLAELSVACAGTGRSAPPIGGIGVAKSSAYTGLIACVIKPETTSTPMEYGLRSAPLILPAINQLERQLGEPKGMQASSCLEGRGRVGSGVGGWH